MNSNIIPYIKKCTKCKHITRNFGKIESIKPYCHNCDNTRFEITIFQEVQKKILEISIKDYIKKPDIVITSVKEVTPELIKKL